MSGLTKPACSAAGPRSRRAGDTTGATCSAGGRARGSSSGLAFSRAPGAAPTALTSRGKEERLLPSVVPRRARIWFVSPPDGVERSASCGRLAIASHAAALLHGLWISWGAGRTALRPDGSQPAVIIRTLLDVAITSASPARSFALHWGRLTAIEAELRRNVSSCRSGDHDHRAVLVASGSRGSRLPRRNRAFPRRSLSRSRAGTRPRASERYARPRHPWGAAMLGLTLGWQSGQRLFHGGRQ